MKKSFIQKEEKVIENKFRLELLTGIALVIISYLLGIFLSNGIIKVGLVFGSFAIGFILLFDSITINIYKKSLLHQILKNKNNLILFIIFSVIGALFIEGIAKWIGKLWIYPYANVQIYFLFIIPILIIYWLFICESYLATKAVIDLFVKGKREVTKPYKSERVIFILVLILGIIIVLSSIFSMCVENSSSDLPLFNLSKEVSQSTPIFHVSLGLIIILLIGLFFILEFVEYKRKETSFIKDIMHGYTTPIFAIIFSTFIFGILMETHNLLYGGWGYINWPFPESNLFGIPLMVFVAWMLHYLFFLSLFRAITNNESKEIWSGDNIK